MIGTGCGSLTGLLPAPKTVLNTDCDVENQTAADAVVVLDWTGGVTPIHPHTEFVGLDLASFPTKEGPTLAANADFFKERVRRQVSRIYCDGPDRRIAVRNEGDNDEGQPADTVVYLTQAVRPDGSMDIGQGEYDPCDQQNDNAAIIYGRRIHQLASVYTFEEWVNVFANVTAHEIAHTLGYAHVARENRPETGRSLFVELMLDRHTMDEMRQEQRFISDLTNCPDHIPQGTLALQGAAVTCHASH